MPRLMSTRDVIRYATVDGARVAGLGRGDRIPRAGHAGRHRRAPHRPSQHLPDQRPDRRGGVGHGHVQRRLGLRRRAGPDAQRVLEADVQRARNLATTAQQPRGRRRRSRSSAPHREVTG